MMAVKRYKERSLGDDDDDDDDDEIYGRDGGDGETGGSEGLCIHGGGIE